MLPDRSNLSPLVNVPKSKAARKRVRAVNPARAAEKREYARLRAEYLERHPLDQIKIALCGFDEDRVLEAAAGFSRRSVSGIFYEGQYIRFADQIHHRNKSRGSRLNDVRWWMATTATSHDLVETRLDWARESGFLLPIQADADGRWGAGLRALETPDFMRARAGR